MDKEDLLYHFFSNSLTESQEKQFQNLLKTDDKFREQFEYESNLKRVVKEKRHRDLKNKLNTFEASVNNKKSNNYSFNYLKIAASIVLLFSLGWIGYQSYFGLDYDDLYVSNFETYPNTVFEITRSDSINSIERQAFVAYEAKDYNTAINKFETLEFSSYLNFYKAQAYLGINNSAIAKELFVKIIENDEQFLVESHWYLALIYLKEKDKPNAIKYLKILQEKDTFNKNKAILLLEKLQ